MATFQKVLRWLDENAEKPVIVIACVAACLLIPYQVFARYFLGSWFKMNVDTSAVEELALFSLIWGTYFAVPLVIKPAKQFACKPRVTKALAELVDLNATVSEMTGVELDYVQYGKSLVHVLAGDEEHKKAVFSEGGRPNYDTPAKELGHDDPHDEYWPRLNVQHQDDGSHGRAVMMRMGNLKYTMREYEKDELYDLDKDPDEQINEIDNPEYKEKLMEMKDYLLHWYQATVDYVPNRKDVR